MALLPTFPIFQKTIRRIIQLVRSIASRSIRFAQKLRGGDKNLTAPVRIYWDDLNNHTLADLVRETETKASGRVHVISLADFRRSIGDLWDKYKERIILIADSTIARKIGRGNTYIEQEEDTWILLLPKLAETDGQDLADSIAATIGEKLMGAKFSLHEAPFPSSAKLDVNKAINPDGSLDVDALKAEVTKVRSIQRSLSSDRTNRPSTGSLFPAAKQTPNPTRVRTIRSKLEQFLIPAWSSDTECLDSFFFRAFTESGVSVFQKETIHLTDADTLESIQGALKLFREMLSRRLRAKLTIPLPFSLLQSALLPHIQKTVSSLPQRERLLHLRLEIVRIPESVDAGSLVNIRETFRPFIRDIAFSTNPLNPNSQILALDHIVVGGELDQDSTLDDESLFQSLLHFRHRAGRRTSYLLGLDSRKNINAALRAGFHEVGGHGLGNVQRQLPDHVTHVSREELLSS